MDIDSMEAGHEIDALLAERVMEWVRVSHDGARKDDKTVFMVYRGERVLKGTPYQVESGFYDASFEGWLPSADSSALDDVIDRLNPEKPFKLQWYFWEGLWHAWFGEVEASAPTRTLATSRAALKATEENHTPS